MAIDCNEELNFACAINVCKDDEVLFGEYCIHALADPVSLSIDDSNCQGRGYGMAFQTSPDLHSLWSLGAIVSDEHDTGDESLSYVASKDEDKFYCFQFPTNGTVPVECSGTAKSFCYRKGKGTKNYQVPFVQQGENGT